MRPQSVKMLLTVIMLTVGTTSLFTDDIRALNNMTLFCSCADFPPSPSRGTTLDAESEALCKCSADLIKEMQDPELLAWELYSSNVISKKQLDEVSVVGLSAVQRKMRLLRVLGDSIAVDPAKFQKLLLVLRKQPPLKHIVNILVTMYRIDREVGDKETGLKGLPPLQLVWSEPKCATSVKENACTFCFQLRKSCWFTPVICIYYHSMKPIYFGGLLLLL